MAHVKRQAKPKSMKAKPKNHKKAVHFVKSIGAKAANRLTPKHTSAQMDMAIRTAQASWKLEITPVRYDKDIVWKK